MSAQSSQFLSVCPTSLHSFGLCQRALSQTKFQHHLGNRTAPLIPAGSLDTGTFWGWQESLQRGCKPYQSSWLQDQRLCLTSLYRCSHLRVPRGTERSSTCQRLNRAVSNCLLYQPGHACLATIYSPGQPHPDAKPGDSFTLGGTDRSSAPTHPISCRTNA